MYRDVGPSYCNSGLLSEVSLALQYSLIVGFTVFIFHLCFSATAKHNR